MLRILGLPETVPLVKFLFAWSNSDGVPDECDGEALPFPDGPNEGAQPCTGLSPLEKPGKGKDGGGDEALSAGTITRPTLYIDLEDQARPLARQLATR